jgi:Polyketide cyclase / dehydrase and lipid transport
MVKAVAVEQSRAIPVDVQQAFDLTLPVPLTTIFRRRYAVLPPISEVRGQDGIWGETGQTRTVVTTDGGTMREQLVEVDPPHSFDYRLNNITGPMRPLVDSVDGRWEFTQAGTGTLVTWRWTLHPRGFGSPFMPVFCRMWRSYARQALEELSDVLIAPESPEPSPS